MALVADDTAANAALLLPAMRETEDFGRLVTVRFEAIEVGVIVVLHTFHTAGIGAGVMVDGAADSEGWEGNWG